MVLVHKFSIGCCLSNFMHRSLIEWRILFTARCQPLIFPLWINISVTFRNVDDIFHFFIYALYYSYYYYLNYRYSNLSHLLSLLFYFNFGQTRFVFPMVTEINKKKYSFILSQL